MPSIVFSLPLVPVVTTPSLWPCATHRATVVDMNAAQRSRPGWAPVHFGEDEAPVRRRLTWRQIALRMFALAIGIYGGLMIAAAWPN